MAQLDIRFLGQFRIIHGSRDITPAFSPRLQLLLAFLLLNDDVPLARKRVAFRFWPDATEKNARNNLRQLLYRLRQALPNADRYLSIDSAILQWQSGSPANIDVDAFIDAVDSAVTPFELESALDLYEGPLLPGHYDDWVLKERERLQRQYVSGLQRLATMLEQARDYEAAAGQLRRLLAAEPLRESSYLRLMRLYARLRDPAAVEQLYQQCVDVLAEELDVDPTPRFYRRYLHLQQVAADRARVEHLPLAPPPFIGREKELLDVVERLRNPDCRLLTLVGPGGIGKTRLSIEAARSAAVDFLDGVAFVALAGTLTSQTLVSTIAAALQLRFAAGKSPREQLLDHLRRREILLVLDNYEHLLPDIALVQEILRGSPRVQLLITSREPLRLRWEWLFQIGGLETPAADAPAERVCAATRLLAHHLARVRTGFVVEEQVRPVLAHIARISSGMPLALELAAAASRQTPLPQLANGLLESADLLTSSYRDAPERHRSMRAVFDHSWQLLSPAQQRTLSRLSIFHSSFDLRAASAVSGATPSTLTTLVDKSLLRRGDDGRFSWHELLRQFAVEKLDFNSEEQRACLLRHARHYSARIEAAGGRSDATPAVMTLLGVEMDNVRLAWRTAAATPNAELLSELVTAVSNFYVTQHIWEEGCGVLEAGIDALRPRVYPLDEASSVERVVLGKILAWYAGLTGNTDLARGLRAADEALALLEGYEAPLERGTVYLFRGNARRMSMEIEAAIDDFQRARSIFQEMGNDLLLGGTLNVLGLAHAQARRFEVAERYGWHCHELAEKIGVDSLTTIAVRNRCEYARRLGKYEDSERFGWEAIEVARRQNDEIAVADALYPLALNAEDQGQYERARELAVEALGQKELQEKAPVQGNRLLILLGRVSTLLGERESARRYLLQALDATASLDYRFRSLELLAAIAGWLAPARPERAAALIALIRAHPRYESADIKTEVGKHADHVVACLPAQVVARAAESSARSNVRETLVALRTELENGLHSLPE